MPEASFVCSNYRGVLRVAREPKTCNYSNVGQLFSAQEVGQVILISKELSIVRSQGPLRGSTNALAGSLALDTTHWSKDPTTQGLARFSCLWGSARKMILLSTVCSYWTPPMHPGTCRTTFFHGFMSNYSSYGEQETEGQGSAAHSHVQPSGGNQTL